MIKEKVKEQYFQGTKFLAAQLESKATSWEGCDKIHGCAMLGACRQRHRRHPNTLLDQDERTARI